MKNKGWVKLYRELFDKPIWCRSTPQQKVILITLILMANHAEQSWVWKGKQYQLQPGQFITSIKGIKKKAGRKVSIQNIRTALTCFEKTYQFLTNEVTKTGRLITIVNWPTYQADDSDTNKDDNKHLTNSQQTPNKDLTPNKNEENEENEKNVREEEDVRPRESNSGNEGIKNTIFNALINNFPILQTGYKPKIFAQIEAWLTDAIAAGKTDFDILNALPVIKETLPASTQLWQINDEMQKVLGGTSESTAVRGLRKSLAEEGKTDAEIQEVLRKLKDGG